MRSFLPALLTTALLAPTLALSQTTMDYRPFRPGHTHTYQTQASASVYPVMRTVRLGAGELRGTDSVYHFAPAYREVAGDTLNPSCLPPAFGVYMVQNPNSPFGAEMQVAANGEYLLRMSTGRTVRLQSRGLHVGNSWQFCNNPLITATVTQRTVQLLGTAQVPDSVVVLTLSTGDSVALSKNYGLLAGLDLRTLQVAPRPTLTFLTVPERGLGGLPNDAPVDWQPGDSVLWYGSSNATIACSHYWSLTCYRTRRTNPAGDTVYYGGTQQYISINYSGGPCGPGGTSVGPVMPFTEARYMGPSTQGLLLGQLSGVPGTTQRFVNRGAYYLPGTAAGCFAGWRFSYTEIYSVDSCTQALSYGPPDWGTYYETLAGFGRISGGSAWDSGSISWYRHGSTICGSLMGFPRSVFLATPALLPEKAVQLYPNPATESARLSLSGTKGGALTLTVTDALGRLTWRQQTTIGPDAEVALPVQSWPRGVYLVRVQLPEGGRTLRLVRE